MSKMLRTAVSKGKRRTVDPTLQTDLDLAYMTPTLIAMGFPSVTLPKRIYRNSMDHASKFLTAKHTSHYRVYNLCSEPGFSYSPSAFDSNWVCYPFDDHAPPPFALLLAILSDIHTWLSSHPENVAAVHCKAGKGRTGVVCCAYLLLIRVFGDARECLEGYTRLRMREGFGDGLTVMGQVRWVYYLDEFLNKVGRDWVERGKGLDAGVRGTEASKGNLRWMGGGVVEEYRGVERKVVGVVVEGVKDSAFGKSDPIIEIVQQDVVTWSSRSSSTTRTLTSENKLQTVRFTPADATIVQGDVCVNVYVNSKRHKVCRVWFNTFFVGFGATHPDAKCVCFGKGDDMPPTTPFEMLQCLAFLPVIGLYATLVAPLQALHMSLRTPKRFEQGYLSHVGLFGELASLIFRVLDPLGVKSNSLLFRGLLHVSGRMQALVGGARVKETETGLWIGGETGSVGTTHVVLNIHGGGFVAGSAWTVALFSQKLVCEFERISGGTKMRVFAVKYGSCPESSFESLLKNCLEAYKHLLELGYKTISIAGDSAGGNAAVNLIHLIATQHAHLVQPVSAILYSPWVDPHVTILPPNYPNEISAQHDMLSVDRSRGMADMFEATITSADLMSRVAPVNWNDAWLADCVPKKGGVLVVYGGGEILRAGIDAFVDKVKKVVDEELVVKKRYPYMPHEFHMTFLDTVGPAKKAAEDVVRESAKFLHASG
ncbi:hypothetical protein HDU98_007633 [Podochytrium sp. JEL0797]|nr:hypothetical protein HDU98_007633 [Podochytrium sp. JEL0797]